MYRQLTFFGLERIRLTLPRMLMTALWIDSGGWVALQLHRWFGFIGYIVGFPLGFFAAVFVTLAILIGRIALLYPFPLCRMGQCHGFGQYVWMRGTIYGYERGGRYRYGCECSDEYVRRGRKFLSVLADGTEVPLKKLVGFRKWAHDVIA